jgi:hypothetical protein
MQVVVDTGFVKLCRQNCMVRLEIVGEKSLLLRIPFSRPFPVVRIFWKRHCNLIVVQGSESRHADISPCFTVGVLFGEAGSGRILFRSLSVPVTQ